MPKRKIESLTLNKIGAHCKDCTPERQSQNHHRCYVVSCACMYHRAYTARSENNWQTKLNRQDVCPCHGMTNCQLWEK